MIRIIALILATIMVFAPLSACGGDVHVNYGDSSMYTDRDMDKAVDEIMDRFNSWRGCKMYSLTYAGDQICKDNLDYCNRLSDGAEFDECIVFESAFRSPIRGGGAWEANEIYTWTWYLARKANGSWELLTWGYC